MIHFIVEGDATFPGLNVQRVSDGGFALILWVGRRCVYFRRRGKLNPVKPRHIIRVEHS